jgi:hypothetical protein
MTEANGDPDYTLHDGKVSKEQKLMISYSGIEYTLESGTPTLHDLCVSLMRESRWCGGTKFFWPVGMHTQIVAGLLKKAYGEPRLTLAGYLHEADEAMGFGDICHGLKSTLVEIRSKKLRERFAVERLGIDLSVEFRDPRLKQADQDAAYAEMSMFFHESHAAKLPVQALEETRRFLTQKNYCVAEYLEAHGRPVSDLHMAIEEAAAEVLLEVSDKGYQAPQERLTSRTGQDLGPVDTSSFYGTGTVFTLPCYPRGHVQRVLNSFEEELRGGHKVAQHQGGAPDRTPAGGHLGGVAGKPEYLSICAFCGAEHRSGKLHQCHPEG